MAPWIFLFLIPAITMRSFAEERKSGTIELLLTRPLSYYQIILGKLLAGVLLVILSLLPTLFYFYSVYRLADPVGNVDTGSIMGSYFGLLLLGSSYVSIGIMCSSFTDNQIVAFITSVFTCFFFYAAFDSLSLLSLPNNVLLILEQLGISAHYQSISKGVIDTRDLVYFFSIDTICVFATAFNLQKKYR
jgi:ABC-2 type transport system permease protein